MAGLPGWLNGAIFPFAGRAANAMQDEKVHRSIDLPDGSGRLVLYDWSQNQDYRLENLVCLDANGTVVWTARLPRNTGPDGFVEISLDGDVIRANTWSCYALKLDQKNRRNSDVHFYQMTFSADDPPIRKGATHEPA
jgi:hypothetical protein